MKISANNIWFTSDTHYNHKNICRGVTSWNCDSEEELERTTRDFPDLDVMNEAIVNNINDCVAEDDWLIHLGDWSFGGFEKIEEFRSKINCKNIVLILGNHDHHIQNNRSEIRKLFTHVSNYEEMDVEHKSGKRKFVLCHYPIISWNDMRKGSIMLHGHQHLKGDDKLGQGRRMDVGICGSEEFRPYHIDEVINLLRHREFIEP